MTMENKNILIKVEVEGLPQATKLNADLTKELDKQETSIAKLREENKRLTKERNEVNLNSEEGKTKLQELNKQLDANNKAIKSNVDAYTKQKIGIGDYKGALDKLVPGLGATADGFTSMTNTAKAFIATPLGAVIGALGIALGALIAYFKNTGSGQDALAEKTAFLKLAFEKFLRGVEALGKVVFETLGFIAGVVEKLIGFISPATGMAIENAKKASAEIARLADDIDAKETELIMKRAETSNQVTKLRIEANEREGKAKKEFIAQAIALEESLMKREMELVDMKISLWQKEHGTKTDLTDEEQREFAQLQADKIALETSQLNETLRLRKEFAELNKVEEESIDLSKQEKMMREDQERIARQLAEEQSEQEHLDRLNLLRDRNVQQDIQRHNDLIEKKKAASQKEFILFQKAEADKTKIAQLESQNRLMALSTGLGMAAGLMKEDTVAHKFLAVARATIDTYVAANAALTAGPIIGPILQALTIAMGLANVARITGIGFAEGGYTGDGGRLEPAGIVHRGEYVVPAHMVKNPIYTPYLSTLEAGRRGYADGGLVTAGATQEANQMAMMTKALNSIQVWASIAEINQKGAEVKLKQSRTEI